LGPWAPGLVEAANIQTDETILDVACGTGVVTRMAAENLGPSGHIIGLYLNDGMLAVAATLGNPGRGKLEWLKNSALEMDLPNEKFDAVLCQQGLQFFPDQHKALLETHCVLREGGRACFSVWAARGPYNDAVGAAITKHIDDAAAQRYHTARDVPDAETLRSKFVDAGFSQVDVTRIEMQIHLPEIESFIIAHLNGTPSAAALGSLSSREQSVFAKDAADGLSDYTDSGDAVVPDFINMVVAVK
jgi:ubiquinone/menaquinone biosynthesis C-methylase UbiE